MSTIQSSPLSDTAKACTEACTECHHACLELLSSFLQPGGPKLDVERYQLLADCAEICEISTNFLLSASKRSYLLCEIGAALADETARSCAAVGQASFDACAEVCRRAAETCRAVVQEQRR